MFLPRLKFQFAVRVRLAGGLGTNEGRVEVYHGGTWGTVGDMDWDMKDSSVVCRMLGLPAPAAVIRGAKYGKGRGSMILSSVQCTGTEASLDSCQYVVLGSNSQYDHLRDAGVVCGDLTKGLNTPLLFFLIKIFLFFAS